MTVAMATATTGAMSTPAMLGTMTTAMRTMTRVGSVSMGPVDIGSVAMVRAMHITGPVDGRTVVAAVAVRLVGVTIAVSIAVARTCSGIAAGQKHNECGDSKQFLHDYSL